MNSGAGGDGGGVVAARVVVKYTTVLPHEPLPVIQPSISTSNSSPPSSSPSLSEYHDNEYITLHGYVHIQGAFTPKQPANDNSNATATTNAATVTTIDETNSGSDNPPSQPQKSKQQQQQFLVSHQQHHPNNYNNEGERNDGKNTNHNDADSNKCLCHDINYIEQTVQANLNHLISSFMMEESEESLLLVKVVSSSTSATTTATISSNAATTPHIVTSNTNANTNNISRIRLTTSSPHSARTLASRLRRLGCSPQDLLLSKQEQRSTSSSSFNSSINDSLHNCCCPHGCGGRYSGKALQVTQVVPTTTTIATSQEDSDDNDENEHDGVVGGGQQNENDENDSSSSSARWPRAAPPKFRRLMLTTSAATAASTNITSRAKGYKPQSSLLYADDEMGLERRRQKTRYVFVENIIDRTTTAIATAPPATTATATTSLSSNNRCENGKDDDNSNDLAADCLLAFLQGTEGTRPPPLALLLQSSPSSSFNDFETRIGMVEDDIRHAFQDALRDALHRDLFTHARQSTSSLSSSSEEILSASFNDSTSHLGVELFLKPVAVQKKGNKPVTHNGGNIGDASATQHHGVYSQLHIGMRSHADATRLIQLWQGKCITLTIQPPKSLLDLVASSSSKQSLINPSTTTINIQTGKLFLDYADQKLPKRSKKVNLSKGGIDDDPANQLPTGYPYSSECTSSTDHVHIPGLHLLHDYIDSADMEQVLLAVLAGPHAPWAQRQYTQSGGSFKRRVQHYGYVFDYETSDVLRRDYDDDDNTKKENSTCYEKEKTKHCCPPLPSIRPTRQSALQMTNADVEEYITSAVKHVKGWELLAGIIERTRRFDFATVSSAINPTDDDGVNFEDDAGQTNHGQKASVTESTEACTKTDTLHQQQYLALHEQQQQHTYPHINQLTINEYTPGQGIGSHVDTETAFDDGLLLITLGGGIVMEFREVVNGDVTSAHDEHGNKTERRKKLMYLPPRSLVLLSGDARYKWEHMIVSRMTDTVNGKVMPRKLRVSLTLRTALTKPSSESTGQQRQAQQRPLPIYETTVFPLRWGQRSDEDASTSAVEYSHTAETVITDRCDLVTPSTESKHVHDVYDAIATQWHHTRGKRGVLWQGATQFLEKLPRGSVVADVGCGDGKYFSAITAASSYVIGMDISEPLLRTAASSTDETLDGPQYQLLSKEKRALSLSPAVVVADCIHVPLRDESCDAAICIAVMHHLSTEGRRIRCLAELRRIVKVGGLINVQAWALEQEDDSKRKFHGTDVLVPFNAQPKYLDTRSHQKNADEYRTSGDEQTLEVLSTCNTKGVAQMMAEKYNGAEFDSKKNLVVFQRYCHLYRKGELEALCAKVPGLEVLESSFERGNHVVSLRAT